MYSCTSVVQNLFTTFGRFSSGLLVGEQIISPISKGVTMVSMPFRSRSAFKAPISRPSPLLQTRSRQPSPLPPPPARPDPRAASSAADRAGVGFGVVVFVAPRPSPCSARAARSPPPVAPAGADASRRNRGVDVRPDTAGKAELVAGGVLREAPGAFLRINNRM